MNKAKKLNLCLITISVIILIVMVMVFLQTDLAYANTASTKLGSLNYEGSHNYCRYDLMIQADGIDDGVITNNRNFQIYLEGKSCKRNIFTTFKYDIDFTLQKDGVDNNHCSVNFTIKDKDAVPGSIRVLFSGPFDDGDYTLIVTGTISSNVNVDINREYSFTVDTQN